MLSAIMIFLASLVFPGIIIRTKSILSGRKGPGIFLPLYDVLRLLRKGAVYSRNTTFLFTLAPTVNLACVVVACLVIPFGHNGSFISFDGDFVVFAYLLALGRFLSIAASLEVGSSFEGMGANREALFGAIVEPAFFIIMGSFSLLTGYTSFSDIFTSINYESYTAYILGGLAAYVFAVIALVENSRMPVDDPKTHLELTMIHEVMILDNSGYDLGQILYTGYLKFALFGAIIANFFIAGLSPYLGIPLFFAIQFGFAVIVGIAESFIARFRMSHNPQFIFTLSSIAILIFIGVLLMAEKIA